MSHTHKAYEPTPEPHRIPGYTGHLSHMRDEIGSRYSIASHRAIAHPSSNDECRIMVPETPHCNESQEEIRRDACDKWKSRNKRGVTDSAGKSTFQRATEFLRRTLFDGSHCNQCAAEEEREYGCKCLKRELQSCHPCKSSNSARTRNHCVHCCEHVESPVTPPCPLMYQRSDETCNKDTCRSKYPCLDGLDDMEYSDCAYCPQPSTTPHCTHSGCPGKYSNAGNTSGKDSTDMFQPQIVPMYYSTSGPPIYLRHEGLPPKYSGHVPGKDFSYGKTFGRVTTDAKRCLVEDCS